MAKTIIYQMWPYAWPGGLKQMTEHLERVKQLSVDYVWLSPIYPSPGIDHGYDVSDYRYINSRFGTFTDFDQFVRKAHSLGLKVLMDLVLNHTSVQHPWFSDPEKSPKYYIWEPCGEKNLYHNWENLFAGPAWQFAEHPFLENGEKKWTTEEYLHLFHPWQADLNWFPRGSELEDGLKTGINGINQELVSEFREIANYWLRYQEVDGFRLDAPQALNKDYATRLDMESLIFGFDNDKAYHVINAIFGGDQPLKTYRGEKPFLMAEVFDPTHGDVIDDFIENVPVLDLVDDVLLKDTLAGTGGVMLELHDKVDSAAAHKGLLLELESHDAPRFTGRTCLSAKGALEQILARPSVQAICLYQGQELGLKNPTQFQLPDELMMQLDTQTAMRFIAGEPLPSLRKTSRANARLPLNLQKYEIQDSDPVSVLNFYRRELKAWKNTI